MQLCVVSVARRAYVAGRVVDRVGSDEGDGSASRRRLGRHGRQQSARCSCKGGESHGRNVAVQRDLWLPLTDVSFLNHASEYNDLRLLPAPDLGALLYVLWQRYRRDWIYTMLGSVLISINPYKHLPHMYTPETIERVRLESRAGGSGRRDVLPHIFVIAEHAYSEMLSTRKACPCW